MFFYLFLLSVSDIGDWRNESRIGALGALSKKTAAVTNKTE